MSRRCPSLSTSFLSRFRARAIGSPLRGFTLIAIRPSMRHLHSGGATERWCRAAWRRSPLGPLGTREHFHSLESFPSACRGRSEAERSARRCLDDLLQFLRGRPVQAGQVAAYHRVDVGDGFVPRSAVGPAARQCRAPRPIPVGPVGVCSSYSDRDLHEISATFRSQNILCFIKSSFGRKQNKSHCLQKIVSVVKCLS